MKIVEDNPMLPHQIHIVTRPSGALVVTCNCLRSEAYFSDDFGTIDNVPEAWMAWNAAVHDETRGGFRNELRTSTLGYRSAS